MNWENKQEREKKSEWEAIAATQRQSDQQVESIERAKRSAAAKKRLAQEMGATKLYKAYKAHPLASRVMTFKEFRKSSRRNRILKSFLTVTTTKADGNSQ